MLCSHAVKKVSIKNKPELQEIDATTFLVGCELSKCTRVLGFTAAYATWQKLHPSARAHSHTMGIVPLGCWHQSLQYLALKPAQSSSKCIFLWLLWVLFCKALLLLTSTAHLSAGRQRLSHQKSAVQVLGDAPRLWQITRCLIRCDNMLLCELYIQHCTEIAPCHAVFGLWSPRPQRTRGAVPWIELLSRTVKSTFKKEVPPLPCWACHCISGYLHCLVSCFQRK